MSEIPDLQRSLLAVLTRDLGYADTPAYGHVPMRHLFAWEAATAGLSAQQVAEIVAEMRSSAAAEGEVIPDPYRVDSLT